MQPLRTLRGEPFLVRLGVFVKSSVGYALAVANHPDLLAIIGIYHCACRKPIFRVLLKVRDANARTTVSLIYGIGNGAAKIRKRGFARKARYAAADELHTVATVGDARTDAEARLARAAVDHRREVAVNLYAVFARLRAALSNRLLFYNPHFPFVFCYAR